MRLHLTCLILRLIAGSLVAGHLLGGSPVVFAHPLHQKPVGYPMVAAFETFYSGTPDSSQDLVSGGMLLLNELNCIACHAAPAELFPLAGRTEATNLAGVGDRLSSVGMELMVRAPRHANPDSTMPSLYSGVNRDLNEVPPLLDYLLSLRGSPISPIHSEPNRGKLLYHQVGCTACHNGEIPGPVSMSGAEAVDGFKKLPIPLIDHYTVVGLAKLLMDPWESRPSGRMPRLGLNAQDAFDIAAYLKGYNGIGLASRRRGMTSRPITPDLLSAKEGREIFFRRNCHACHRSHEPSLPPPIQSVALEQLSSPTGRGCLASIPVGGNVPAFFLSESQQNAIVEAIGQIGKHTIPRKPKIERLMMGMNCFACHAQNAFNPRHKLDQLPSFFSRNSADAALIIGVNSYRRTTFPRERLVPVLLELDRRDSRDPLLGNLLYNMSSHGHCDPTASK